MRVRLRGEDEDTQIRRKVTCYTQWVTHSYHFNGCGGLRGKLREKLRMSAAVFFKAAMTTLCHFNQKTF